MTLTFNRWVRGAGGRAIGALLTAGVVILIGGLVRYGGPEGVWRRVYGEIAPLLPHPAYVPTPLPIAPTLEAAGAPDGSVTLTPAAPSRPAATGSPSPTPPGAPTPTPTSTGLPAVTRTAVPTRAQTPAASTKSATRDTPSTPSPSSTSLRLTGLSHYWQTWNNCGPATLAMHLSYFGIKIDQDKVGAALRPFKDDKNVSPEELASYAREQGLQAMVRVNGNDNILRQLLAIGVPVLIETWYEPKPNDGMGHYRLIVGFDDAAEAWIAYDSYDSRDVVKGQPYQGIRLPYAETDALWAIFNRVYVVLYDTAHDAAQDAAHAAAHAAAVEEIIGADEDDAAMWARSLAAAEAATLAKQSDPFAWFNLGSSLTALDRFAEAADAFDRARRLGLPWRMLWYQFAPFRAYYEVGRYDEVIALADATLRSAKDTIEELYYWKGMAQHAAGDPVSARASWQAALALNLNYADARAAYQAAPEGAP